MSDFGILYQKQIQMLIFFVSPSSITKHLQLSHANLMRCCTDLRSSQNPFWLMWLLT